MNSVQNSYTSADDGDAHLLDLRHEVARQRDSIAELRQELAELRASLAAEIVTGRVTVVDGEQRERIVLEGDRGAFGGAWIELTAWRDGDNPAMRAQIFAEDVWTDEPARVGFLAVVGESYCGHGSVYDETLGLVDLLGNGNATAAQTADDYEALPDHLDD
ncbi:MAG TPA: hypothetical protein VGI86_21745 [Acidimicrobiia bacterium]|jgi:hypothetical protein